MDSSNPFEAASMLGRKRDADESGLERTTSMEQEAFSASAHPVMPLPKRRITDVSVPTMASMNNDNIKQPDSQAYHAFDLLPHSPQHSLNFYPNLGFNQAGNATNGTGSPGIHTDSMGGFGYYSGTIAVSNPENGQVDPHTKHVLRHIQMPSYNPSAPSSSLNSPSAHSVFTTTTDADAPFLFEHDSPDMMRDEDTSDQMQTMQQSNDEAMMMQMQQQQQAAYMQQQQQQQQQYEAQMQMQMQQQQQQQAMHPMLNPSQPQPHPLSNLAGTGLFTTQNPVQAAYDSYNGGFLDEFDDALSGRYTGNSGDSYAARLENVMGHA